MLKQNSNLQAIAEHQLFKTAIPIITAVLIGSVSYLFSTVLELEKEVYLLKAGKLPTIEQGVKRNEEGSEELETQVMEIRIFKDNVNSNIPRLNMNRHQPER